MAVGFLGFTGSLLFTHLCTGPLDPPHSSWYIFWYLSRSAVKFSSKNSFTVHFCRKNPSRTPDHGFMVQYGTVRYGRGKGGLWGFRFRLPTLWRRSQHHRTGRLERTGVSHRTCHGTTKLSLLFHNKQNLQEIFLCKKINSKLRESLSLR